MDEKNKLLAIEGYLKELFPGCVIENEWDAKSSRHVFRVAAITGKIMHTIGISSEFVSANESDDIVICLNLYNLKGYLEMYRDKEVLVTDDGINPEGTSPSLLT